jgi:hypothetical protein
MNLYPLKRVTVQRSAAARALLDVLEISKHMFELSNGLFCAAQYHVSRLIGYGFVVTPLFMSCAFS